MPAQPFQIVSLAGKGLIEQPSTQEYLVKHETERIDVTDGGAIAAGTAFLEHFRSSIAWAAHASKAGGPLQIRRTRRGLNGGLPQPVKTDALRREASSFPARRIKPSESFG